MGPFSFDTVGMAPKNKNKGKPRNYSLESGVVPFGKSKTYHKKAIYKFLMKKTRKCFSNHKRVVRPSLKAGTIAIMVAGVHKGKRVIVLKTLSTGLLLVTGPFKVNGCPLRRVNQ